MKDSLWSVDLFSCESITLKSHWVMVILDQYTRRVIGFAVHAGDCDGITYCRLFNEIIIQRPRGAKILPNRHANAVHAIAFSLDGNRLVAGGADGTMHHWDMTNPDFPGKRFYNHQQADEERQDIRLDWIESQKKDDNPFDSESLRMLREKEYWTSTKVISGSEG